MKSNNNSTTKYKALKDKLPKKPADEYDRKVVSYLKKKYNEQSELDEAVTVKKEKHSWGKMVTVHHGSETSYPLHPEHQAAIKKLRPGMKTTFKDETNSTVHASREGDMVHLHRPKTSNKLTSVAYSHFDEQVELGFKNFKNSIIEKTLTPAEMKKREEVAKAIEREKPNMPMGMKMAIATKTAKRVAENTVNEESYLDMAKGSKTEEEFHSHMLNHHLELMHAHKALGDNYAVDTHKDKAQEHANKLSNLGDKVKFNEENNLKEGRGDVVLKTNASSMDANDTHIQKLKDSGIFAQQGAGASHHIIVGREHEEKAREILGSHLKEDAIEEKLTLVHGPIPPGHNNKPTTSASGVTSGVVYSGRPAKKPLGVNPALSKPISVLDKIRAGMKKTNENINSDNNKITELSSELLGRYKKAASTSASAADAKGDMATGNKRFSGIMKATKKQFNNDMKTEEVDDEGKMAKGQLMRMVNQASALAQMMEDDKQLDGWVQSKLTMASDYLDSVHDYLMHNKQDVDEMEEGLEEATQFSSKEHAISYAKEKVKSHKDSDDGIEVYSMPSGGARVVHSMNSQGRQQVLKSGGKKVTTVTREQVESVIETKGAPKGFHFTKDGKLKRGDANQDGDGGPMLRSDPLDKQRNKIPAVSEAPEGEHLCAKRVYSNMFGEGVVVDSLHAEPDEEGNIEWYAVQFEEGIKKVFTEKLQVMTASYHGNHKKKRMTNGR